MAYNPATDFLGLLRSTGGGVRSARMPGLDFIIEGLIRAGLVSVFVGQSPPIVNQSTTVWFQPAVPSFNGEGRVNLFNASLGVYQPATPALWALLLRPANLSPVTKILTAAGPYAALPTDEVLIVKQAVGAAFTVNVDWSQRARPLRVVDGKGDASAHPITITPAAGQTQLALVNFSYVIDGNGGSITLTPLPDNTGAY